MYNLGLSYRDGTGVPPDEGQAFHWFEKAAKLGLSNAQLKTGFCYYNGTGVTENPAEGVSWYRKAAQQGDVQAIANLGLAYKDGKGVNKDLVEAWAWLDIARFGTQHTDNMRLKWGIRGYQDEVTKQLTSPQIKEAKARSKKLWEDLESGRHRG